MHQPSRFLKPQTIAGKFFRIVLILVCCACPPLAAGQDAPEIVALELNKSVEREIAGGQRHEYRITLNVNQYLAFTVLERGIEVIVEIIAPDGKTLMEIEAPYSETEPQSIHFAAAVAGDHRLIVKPAAQNAAGRYEIKVKELRAATEKDRDIAEAFRLNVEGRKLRYAGKYAEALAAMEKTLAILEKTLGAETVGTADTLNEIGLLYGDKNDYKKAEEYLRRALTIYEKTHGAEHFYVASILNNLAAVYNALTDFEKAEASYLRALAINEKKFGAEHLNTATISANLGFFYYTKGDYSKAEEPLQRALSIREKQLGADSFDVAAVMNNLALLYRVKGDHPKAALFLERARAVAEKVFSPDHPNVATLTANLAAIIFELGDYEKAEQLFRRALEIREKAFGAEHLDIATSLNNLAAFYENKADYEKAEPLYQRGLAIREKILGAEHQTVAASLGNLGLLYRTRGAYEKAEPLLRRALEINEKKLGREHPSIGTALNNLGLLFLDRGEYAPAETHFQRALTIFETANGKDNPITARPLDNLARLYAAKGDFAQALIYQEKYLAVRERNLELNLFSGSERQKLAYMNTLARDMASTISLHTQLMPQSEQLKEATLNLVLGRKGRTLDAMGDSISALRRRALDEDRKLIDRLSDARTQLATLALRGAGNEKPELYRQRLAALEEKRENLEGEMSRRSAEFRLQTQPATLAAIRALIPENAALVEFVAYRPANLKSPAKNESAAPINYVAYILRRRGTIEWRNLGDAQPIDLAINEFRQALRDPKRKDAQPLARALDEKIMQPIRRVLGETEQLLISPDGDLNLIPFEALVDEQNHYLVENYSFTYLTSGRDLLRMQTARKNENKSLIVANPSFGEPLELVAEAKNKTDRRKRRGVFNARDLSETYFTPLGATGDEARAIQTLFPDATFLIKDQATESALKKTNAPRILHIATHGFFLEDADAAQTAVRGSNAVGKIENPLVRSGLALAGANRRDGKTDDGILTALEASNMNLWGTKLVVLSACDTGVGEVKNGEGVYGLRRAFVLAGAESMVMSLWAVSDSETRRLMTDYYKNLKAGTGRGAALRQAQLAMLKKDNYQHPFFWAAFIQSGEWANLDGKR